MEHINAKWRRGRDDERGERSTFGGLGNQAREKESHAEERAREKASSRASKTETEDEGPPSSDRGEEITSKISEMGDKGGKIL